MPHRRTPRRLGILGFGRLLRETPLRFLNLRVYLGGGRDAQAVRAQAAASARVEKVLGTVFVWAYAPPLAVLHRSSLRTDQVFAGGDTCATPIVVTVMWVVVPLLMAAVPYAFGWSAGIVGAFLVANTFHISATVVGIGGAWAWRQRLSGPKAKGVDI